MSANSFIHENNIDGATGTVPMSLPREAILDTVPRSSLVATKKIVNLVPISANSVGPSQTLQFLIPQRNFAKANSFYLKFKIALSGGTSNQTRWSFSGGMQSAAALINNISLQAGGAVVESLQNYHVWHNNVVEWMQSGKDMLSVESMCSGARPLENYNVGGIAVFTSSEGAGATTVLTPTFLGTVQPQVEVGYTVLQMSSTGAINTASATYVTAISSAGVITLAASITKVAGDVFWCFPPVNNSAQQTIGYDYNSDTVATSATGFVVDGKQDSTANCFGTQGSLMQFSRGGANQSLNMVFTIPIYCGFFNPKESQLVPLEYINGGVLLTIQTNPVTKAFWTEVVPSATTGFTTYTLSDFELCYAEIQPNPEYMAQVRADLAGGKLIKIETQSYQNFILQESTTSTRQMFNANLSSLACILWGRVVGTDDWTTSKNFQWVGNDGNNTTRYEVYFDNQLIFQSAKQLTDISVVIRQLQEAIGSAISEYPIAPYVQGRGIGPAWKSPGAPAFGLNYNTYCGGHALMGLSTRVFSSNSTSMDGMPVGTITINFYNDDGTSTNNLLYFYLVYDYIYLVDASGSVSKVQ